MLIPWRVSFFSKKKIFQKMGLGRHLLWRGTFFVDTSKPTSCRVVELSAGGLWETSKTHMFSFSNLDLHGHVVKKLEQRSECDL